MDKTALQPPSSALRNIYKFYFIVFAIIFGSLIGERLFEEFVFLRSFSFFEGMIISITIYVVLLFFTLFYAKHTNTSNYEMGLHGSYVPKSLLVGFLATSGYLVAIVGFQLPPNYRSVILIVDILLFTLLIGITEETMFRGYIQANFLRSSSQMKAIFLTGFLFAFLHIPSYIVSGSYLSILALPSLVLIGLIFGFTRIHTGNIWGVAIAHATWDFYQLLFTPEITPSSDLIALIPVLISSLAMWGTVLFSMFFAKWWIDRPTQMPDELVQEYSHKIENLIQRNWRVQQSISGLQLSGFLNQVKLERYYSKIRTDEDIIAILKKLIPEINASNYKLFRSLVPLEMKRIKIENLLKLPIYAARKANLQANLLSVEAKITEIREKFNTKST